MEVVFSIMIDGAEVTFFRDHGGKSILRIRASDINNPPDYYLTPGQVNALTKAFKAIEAVKR